MDGKLTELEPIRHTLAHNRPLSAEQIRALSVLEHFTELKDLDLRKNFVYLNRRLTLATGAHGAQETDLRQLLDELRECGPFDVFILDPLTRFYDGLDENDNGNMTRIMKAFDTIREETGAAILFSHHTGKIASRAMTGDRARRGDPTQARGASVLSDQSHVVVSLAKGHGATLALTWAKSNYAALRAPLVFERTKAGLLLPAKVDERLQRIAQIVQLGRGMLERSCLIKEIASALNVGKKQAGRLLGKAEEMGMITRVDRDKEPDSGGKFCALPDAD